MSKHVLIVDNDEMNRGLLRLVLEYDGCHCSEAADGTSGLALLESQTFDVVILDQAMPGMTGIEFLHQLRKDCQQTNVPVIMVTGLLNPELREEALCVGAYAIIEKPYDFGALRLMVAQAVPSPSPQLHLLPQ